jgi:RNA polymerase sigma-70 factor (ECF subfamily)
MTEHEAITRLQRGDIVGLEALVHAYQVRAVRAAFLIVRDRALAEDLVQAAFLRVYARIGQFDSRRPFGPWFLRSVINYALKAAARRERSLSLDGDDPDALPLAALVAPDLALDDRLAAAETSAAIWAALGALPPEQRTAIVLRYYLDLSEAEMAARLAVPPGTIKSRLHTARRRLRALLPAWLGPKGGLL